MQHKFTMRTAYLLFLVLLLGVSSAAAQQGQSGRVTIEVTKSQNGQMNKESEVRSADDVGSLEGLLRQYGVQEELTDLQPGEEVEVIIRRKQKEAPVRDMVIKIDREFDLPPLPPVPPMPEIAKRPLLGVYYEADAATGGGRITSVMPGTGAEEAGLQAGDVILAVDGKTIKGQEALVKTIQQYKSGDQVNLTLLREGKEFKQKAILGENTRMGNNFEWRGNIDFDEFPAGKRFEWKSDVGEDQVVIKREMSDRPMLGVMLMDAKVIMNGEEVGTDGPGVSVKEVIPGTAAEAMGLQAGDRITKVNGARVAGHEGIGQVLKQSKVGDRVEIEFLRKGETMTASAPLSAWKAAPMEEKHYEIHRDDANGMDFEEFIFTEPTAATTTREFRMVVRMEDVSTAEAEALSARSGDEFSGQSDLALESFMVGPNPSNGAFTLAFSLATKGQTEIRVLDLDGVTIFKEDLGNFSGTYTKDFDIGNFSKGVYFLQITQSDRAFTKKVVTQ